MTRYSTIADLRRNISPDVRIVADATAEVRALQKHGAASMVAGAAALGETAPLEDGRVSQSIVLPLPPSANRYWRNYNGRVVVSEAAKTYKAGVWMQAQHAGLHPFTGPVAVYVHVYRGQKRGDLDNANKVLLDSLCGIAYQDDAQIVELHSWQHDDAANPRVEVEVRRVQP